MFREKEIRPLGFSRRGELIGETASSEVGPGGLTTQVGAARGWAAPLVVRLALAPLHLIFGLREASVKIGGSAFVSPNSENISCVTFLKHKNSRK
jgi:hypothetical protein